MKRPHIKYGELDGLPVAYIPLTQGYWAIVDREDLVKVPGPWYYHQGYAHQNKTCDDGKRTTISMHDVIMPPPEGKETDHRFGNKLDNRKEVLRCVEHVNNTRNRKKHKNNTSGYKGVYWHEGDGRLM